MSREIKGTIGLSWEPFTVSVALSETDYRGLFAAIQGGDDVPVTLVLPEETSAPEEGHAKDVGTSPGRVKNPAETLHVLADLSGRDIGKTIRVGSDKGEVDTVSLGQNLVVVRMFGPRGIGFVIKHTSETPFTYVGEV